MKERALDILNIFTTIAARQPDAGWPTSNNHFYGLCITDEHQEQRVINGSKNEHSGHWGWPCNREGDCKN